MRFPQLERVHVIAQFSQFQAGRLHSSGRRFLPLIVLTLSDGNRLGVVDRHHRVDSSMLGVTGNAQLIFLLSVLELQTAQQRGLDYDQPNAISTAPTAHGMIVDVLTWEQHRELGYDAIYSEMLVDVGIGIIGVRTNITTPDFAASMGIERFHAGDWITIRRSRIDILGFRLEAEG